MRDNFLDSIVDANRRATELEVKVEAANKRMAKMNARMTAITLAAAQLCEAAGVATDLFDEWVKINLEIMSASNDSRGENHG